MDGLALAERYFQRHGLPMLAQRFPAYQGRIAAGLIGDGSDCLGFDDEYSRDHDWGPGFCLWLTEADHRAIGPPLAEAYANLPARFEGHERVASEWGGGRVGVFEIGAFLRGFIGRPTVPATELEWLRIPEKNLAACTAGRIFRDPHGEFSEAQRRLRDFYPDDVRLAKIAARCMSAGQSGQYNYLRSVWRGEGFAAQYAETKFCADAMSLVYLINRRYAPYYKWMRRGLASLPRLGALMAEQSAALARAPSPEAKQEVIDAICAALIAELQAEGLTDSGSRFLVDHGAAVHSSIGSPALRQINPWAAP